MASGVNPFHPREITMQKHNHVPTLADVEINGVTLEEAVEKVQHQANKVVKSTENVVRRYPLRSMGVAVGSGVAAGVVVGVAAHAFIASRRHPPTVLERLGTVAIIGSAVRGMSSLFRR